MPGWSIGTLYLHNHVEAGGGRTFQVGGGFQAGLKADVDLGMLSASYVFATPVLGAQLAIGAAAAYGRNDASINATLTGPNGAVISGSREQTQWGFSDFYPQASLKWNNGVNNYMIYTMWGVPMGAYSSARFANIGIGHWAADAGAGYTYFNPANGWEASIVGGLTYNFKNPSTDYQNGIDGHIDWAVSRFLAQWVHVGVVGYYFQQLTADSGQPAILGDNKGRVAGIGPQIGFLFPAGDMHGYLNIKAYKEFAAERRPEGWNAWVTLAFSPAPPSHGAAK